MAYATWGQAGTVSVTGGGGCYSNGLSDCCDATSYSYATLQNAQTAAYTIAPSMYYDANTMTLKPYQQEPEKKKDIKSLIAYYYNR